MSCPHSERVEGVCTACGDCAHEVILNGACLACGATDLPVVPKSARVVIPADELVRKKPT